METLAKTRLVNEDCCACGVQYAIPETMRNHCLETGDGWYCPNGHSLSFTEPRSVVAKKELARERAAHDQTKAALEQTTSELETLATKGKCPCCRRNFVNLRRHMKTSTQTSR